MERARLLQFASAMVAVLAPAYASEVVLHNFGCPPQGANPYAGVIRDAAGNLYGTASNGGAAGAGVVFKVDTSGDETVLYSFTGGADGGLPIAGLIRDSAGNLYGTAEFGGAANAGVVFKVDASGHETVLFSFSGMADGGFPVAGVTRDSAGNLYGTTSRGGTAGRGVVYKLDTTGHESVLLSFTSVANGFDPRAGVVRDSAGNLYGTTFFGGAICDDYGHRCGVVYKLDTAGNETVLHKFTGGADGAHPIAGVILDSAGNLYGTTFDGVVYKLSTNGQETVLHRFTGGADGEFPVAGVIRDSAGNLYGTTAGGGTANQGVVYKLNTAGNETVLHSFTGGTDGSNPQAGVILDSAGNLYGTTANGDVANLGIVYKLDTTGEETVLFRFPGPVDGSDPSAGVILDAAGNLYGTTFNGGAAEAGVVYKLNGMGNETVVHSFAGGVDGSNPVAGVVADAAGNLYGTTSSGGTVNVICSTGCGTVYKVDTTGQKTTLHSFTGGADGAGPVGGVILDSAGNLYGTTAGGGANMHGVVYKLDTTGHQTVLYSFTGVLDGGYPQAGVVRDAAGNLYGTTEFGGPDGAGVVFKLDTSGHETVLHSFPAPFCNNDGGFPTAGLIRDSAGNLYGTTFECGAAGFGVVYKLDSSGHETILYNFTGGADGGDPSAGVILDSAGNLYGTTALGGAANRGVVFKLDTSGHETVLSSFTGGADGSQPAAGVIRDLAGNLYGTTQSGGSRRTGVVFKITP